MSPKPRTTKQAPNPWVPLTHLRAMEMRAVMAEADLRALIELVAGPDYLSEHAGDWHEAAQALLPKRLRT
jgi:hypothetical protein